MTKDVIEFFFAVFAVTLCIGLSVGVVTVTVLGVAMAFEVLRDWWEQLQ